MCIANLNNGSAVDALYPSCEQYMGEMASLKENSKCTMKDFETTCDNIRNIFTSELQVEYCQGIVKANDEFWEKNKKHFGWCNLKGGS